MPTRRRKLRMRDVSYMKPHKFRNYLTLTELCDKVKRDMSWIKKLEKEDRIPQAKRVKFGQLEVRLWSPEQVKEIEEILSNMRVGRPSKNG